MNKARFQAIHNGLTIVAQKVFSAVPIAETWTATQIHQELARQNLARDFGTTQGCINSLVQSGIVLEPKRGYFRRIKVRIKELADIKDIVETAPATPPESVTPKEEPVMALMPAPNAAPLKLNPGTPLDRLSSLSGRVQQMMAGLKLLAEDIETAALEIADQMAENEENARKLKLLQGLLKDIG